MHRNPMAVPHRPQLLQCLCHLQRRARQCREKAQEACPVWPGQPMTAHWGVPDPAAVEGSDDDKRKAFFQTFNQLQNRISMFASLPLDKIDRIKLQKTLQDIGKTTA